MSDSDAYIFSVQILSINRTGCLPDQCTSPGIDKIVYTGSNRDRGTPDRDILQRSASFHLSAERTYTCLLLTFRILGPADPYHRVLNYQPAEDSMVSVGKQTFVEMQVTADNGQPPDRSLTAGTGKNPSELRGIGIISLKSQGSPSGTLVGSDISH